jgi:PmbA protein
MQFDSSEVVKKALAAGFEEAVAMLFDHRSFYLKIANSKIDSIIENKTESGFLFVTKDKKLVQTNIQSKRDSDVKDAIARVTSSIKTARQKEDYFGLAEGPFKYKGSEHYDKVLANIDEQKLSDIANSTINAALSNGAQSIAGTVFTTFTLRDLSTSKNVHQKERFTEMRVTARAMAKISSYQENVGSNSLSGINPARVGKKAAELATSIDTKGAIKSGEYDVIYMPSPAGSLLGNVTSAACATELENGSFLTGKFGKEVAMKELTLYDDGASPKAINASICDSEGYPTQRTKVVCDGIFTSMLHNNSTAKKYKTTSTGNAGLLFPDTTTTFIEFKKTVKDLDKLIGSVDKGILVSNIWYTRYKNYLTGEFSTVPRDLTIYIEKGKPMFAIRQRPPSSMVGIRISDSFLRIIKNIKKAAQDTVQATNWDADGAYYFSPSILVSGVKVTAV